MRTQNVEASSHQHSGNSRIESVHILRAEKELAKAGYSFAVEEVIFIELKHRPGTLAKQVEKLADKSIGVRYAYATAHAKGQTTAVVIAVAEQDFDRALKLLG